VVKIKVNGQDMTRKISDWKIWNSSKKLMLTCYFPSGKSYYRSLSECEVTPTVEMENKLLVKKGGNVFSHVDKVVVYGNKQAVVLYSKGSKPYVMNLENIQLIDETNIKDTDIFQYFITIANARAKHESADNNIADNVVRQLEVLPSSPETALHAYCEGNSQSRVNDSSLIFPFGINESQLHAVEGAFSSQISLIEGPPGTGKTQTILNILANILLRKKTVAVLSNNNTAVENIYEKLNKEGLDFLVAKLGNTDNRKAFFANQPQIPYEELNPALPLEQIDDRITRLKQLLRARNEVAKLQAEIDELQIERKYLLQWREDNPTQSQHVVNADWLKKYRLTKQKNLDLMAYLTLLDDKSITLKNRIEMLINFRIFRTQPFNSSDKLCAMTYALQLNYYDNALQEKEADLAASEELLKSSGFDSLLEDVTISSMAFLKEQLQQRNRPKNTFALKDYKNNIDEFLIRYPIIGSGSHSIINSLKPGTVLDFVIIDEASQQDIVPGILALGCARNLIIVGDRKQLPAIFTKTGCVAPDDRYDCEKQSLLDSCLEVFGDNAPVTLLKEHYRCHPRIIQFCNQQFYDNQLIPMTKDAGEEALQLIVTAKGNHTRGHKNQRELDSLLNVLEQGESNYLDKVTKRGFIAPYNAQVNLSTRLLPESFVKDTTHKFQGRECDEIVFSTVLDNKLISPKDRSFVDDPQLINVAVSRAQKHFTLLTGDEVFSKSNGPIAALTRYIEYYMHETSKVHYSPVISAFDLLYREYDKSLEKLRAKLRRSDSQFKSEQIVAQLLRESLLRSAFNGIVFHTEVALNQLVSSNNEGLTAKERTFMQSRSRCDFVLYFKVGKTPIAVIEVDGGSHTLPKQMEWDALKNSILEKGKLPLLRLKTIDSHIEKKLEDFIFSIVGQGSLPSSMEQ
jgi:superfamily I DNA and/or RNA helicase